MSNVIPPDHINRAWQKIADKQDENFRLFMASLRKDVVKKTMLMMYDSNLKTASSLRAVNNVEINGTASSTKPKCKCFYGTYWHTREDMKNYSLFRHSMKRGLLIEDPREPLRRSKFRE